MAIRKCELCDRTEATHRIMTSGLCTTCDVALHYWRKKTPTKIMARARQIQSFQNRMAVLMGNVKSIDMAKKPRKRKSAA